MELKKIFPKWWHPGVPTAFMMLLVIMSGTMDVLTAAMFAGLAYSFYYVGFVFCRTGYLVVKDVCRAITK